MLRARAREAKWAAVFRCLTWRPSRGFLIPAGAGAAILLVLALSFGPIVRARVAKEAERRRLDVEIQSVRPGFFAVDLRGVRIRPRDVPGIDAHFDAVRVELGATLSVREVLVKGGLANVEGEPEDLVDRLRNARKGSAAPERTAKTPLHLEGLTIRWLLPSGGEISGAGLRVSREEESLKLGCAKCSATRQHVAVALEDVSVELSADGILRTANVAAVTAVYDPPKPPAPPPTALAVEPTPAPLPSSHRRSAKNPPPKAEIGPVGPILPFPDLHALRAKIATAVATVAPRLPDGGAIDIGGLSLRLGEKEGAMTFGPGKFGLARRGDRVHLTFASAEIKDAPAHGTPLAIDADLPVNGGEMTARLAGGPVSLAALGVAEGMRGISDVARGTLAGKGQLVLDDAATALTFDGEVTIASVSLKEERIAPEPLRNIGFTVSGRGMLDDKGNLRVDDAELDMGALHVRTHGTASESADHFAIALALDVAPAACQALVESAPEGLLPTVRPARMNGSFGANANLAFDTRTIDKLLLEYRIDDQCRMVEVPRDLARERFEGTFSYRTYKPDGTVGETTTGPGTASWTALDDVSPFMVAALLTTEDGGFYKHKGFNHAAIRSSVQANLKARRFVRGASTITMQLAKNLFLARNKALSRKIEEVILTDYLEQVFRKDDLMELYLNVVEFGPDVYGVTGAADYYFGRKPEELNVGECFFLASLLPSPIRYGKLREKGEISESWMHHLKALMEIAARNGKITRAELEDGLKTPITFVRDGEARPEPRKPVTTQRRDPYGDDDTPWHPLD